MKPLSQRTDAEWVRLAREAEALPDAPAAWIDRALALMPQPAPARVGMGGELREVLQAGWRVIRASLRFDSARLAPGAVLAVRSGQASDVRQLLFSAEGRDVDLRVARSAAGFSLLGQLLGPDEGGTVELQLAPMAGDPSGPSDRSPIQAEVDALGEFRFEGLLAGECRMTFRLGTDAIELPPFVLDSAPGSALEKPAR